MDKLGDLIKSNEQQRLLEILNDIKEHNLILRDYFVQLGALAERMHPQQLRR
jgi:hypothetical protein